MNLKRMVLKNVVSHGSHGDDFVVLRVTQHTDIIKTRQVDPCCSYWYKQLEGQYIHIFFWFKFTFKQNEAYNVLQIEKKWQSTNDGVHRYHLKSRGESLSPTWEWWLAVILSQVQLGALLAHPNVMGQPPQPPQPLYSMIRVMFATSPLLMEHLIPSVDKAL